ncbi:MAG: hypothetical protein S4CHLAM45_05090 [Chlamydiales bacterium]|nr:hypothetical protein [Chlamydiales bacterium]MCH9619950.1 hypothetical protein [Chlamydiales bacterium]MCH9622623.1 hypothetical protein [Chlamydiales bacterium]
MKEDIICIHKVYDSIEAELIKIVLRRAGISSFLKTDDAGGELPQLTMTSGICLMIQREDEAKAIEAIQNWIKSKEQ